MISSDGLSNKVKKKTKLFKLFLRKKFCDNPNQFDDIYKDLAHVKRAIIKYKYKIKIFSFRSSIIHSKFEKINF